MSPVLPPLEPERPVADRHARLVGTRYDPAVVAGLPRDANLRNVRVVRQGDMIVQDFRADRLTIVLNADDEIVAVSIG